MKSIHEILRLLLKEIEEKYPDRLPPISDGLCLLIEDLKMSSNDRHRFDEYLHKFPTNQYLSGKSDYFWPQGNVHWRTMWLKKHIKLTKP